MRLLTVGGVLAEPAGFPVTGALAAAHEAGDGGHHLVGPLILLAGLRPDHAGVRVAVEEAEGDLVERGLGG